MMIHIYTFNCKLKANTSTNVVSNIVKNVTNIASTSTKSTTKYDEGLARAVSKTLESKSEFTNKFNKTKDSKSTRVLVVERTFAQRTETEVLNQLWRTRQN